MFLSTCFAFPVDSLSCDKENGCIFIYNHLILMQVIISYSAITPNVCETLGVNVRVNMNRHETLLSIK